MGISDHIELDDLGHETTHLFDGTNVDMEGVAVDTMGCGPLTIIMPPEHPDDDIRDQHALFLRARTLDGKEVELMFNISQVALLHEQCVDVQDAHIQQAFNLLGAPDHITEGYDDAKKQLDGIIGIITSISTMAETIMRLQDVKNDDGTIDEDKVQGLSHDEALNLLNLVNHYLDHNHDDDGEDDES